MLFEENPKTLFEEKFHSLDISTLTPDDLINILEDDNVILSLTIDDDSKFRLSSHAIVAEDIMRYTPIYILEVDQDSSLPAKIIKSDNLKDWCKEFAKAETMIDIDNEWYEPVGNDKQFLYDSLSEKNTQIYISDDRGNFYGPLECEFMELWLAINENYYI